MSTAAQTFDEYLEKRGLRFTSQRREIVRQALAMDGHFEAEDLHDRLRKCKSGRVSKASIYRTLPLLVEAGLLREVEFVDRHMHYETLSGEEHHAHLICTSCRRIIEFRAPSIGKTLRSVVREYDFEEHSRKVEVTGLCSKCRRISR